MSEDPEWHVATCFKATHPPAYNQMRNAIIEECAREIESFRSKTKGLVEDVRNDLCEELAAAIRALKDKT